MTEAEEFLGFCREYVEPRQISRIVEFFQTRHQSRKAFNLVILEMHNEDPNNVRRLFELLSDVPINWDGMLGSLLSEVTSCEYLSFRIAIGIATDGVPTGLGKALVERIQEYLDSDWLGGMGLS